MKVDTFDFNLPRACIAQRPMTPRDAARLLVVNGEIGDSRMSDFPRHLHPGDLLVFNDTKVIPARLSGRRGQAKVEVTLHKSVDTTTWKAFARPARRLRKGDRIDFAPGFAAEVETKGEAGEVTLSFEYGGADLETALERFGVMPLPPYIKRPNFADPRDRDDYQTMFARIPGAVAAPTAGLHFTPGLLDDLDARGIERIALTLHVGAGTFLPVKVEDVADHKMHAEWGEITAPAAAAVNATRARGNQVVAVGSTALRLLEAATDAAGRLRPFAGETDIFITPGYRFRTVDRLLTNFHLPRSTLFMLVSAFAGTRRMKHAYAHAKDTGYRFYSYGDACLLGRSEAP
jgi:S-adenosylmethionine:tRNA ribosyltransferase-isomerase